MQEKLNITDTIKYRLWKLSGGDYIIIKSCEQNIKDTFAAVGLLVCLSFILCFISGMYTTYHFFGSFFFSIPIAIFFAWMVINIYLVLLTTLSKNLLPHQKDVTASRISLGIRTVFVLFMAIVISKPIESLILEDNLFMTKEVSQHKLQLINDIIGDDARISKYDKEFITRKVNENYFFSFRLRKVNSIPIAWGVTLIIAILFFLPSIITFKITKTSGYYYRKGKLERRLIDKEYSDFLELYRKKFQLGVGYPVSYKPVCIVTEPRQVGLTLKNIDVCYPSKNPPYNTKPLIQNRSYKKQSEFIDLIHSS